MFAMFVMLKAFYCFVHNIHIFVKIDQRLTNRAIYILVCKRET